MTIKEFIEAAIDGGWNPQWNTPYNEINPETLKKSLLHQDELYSDYYGFLEMSPNPFLNPECWKAVGKVKGWGGNHECGSCEYPQWQDDPEYHMSKMIRELCKGKTLEEYIATL